MPIFERVAVVGLGLLGGSLALAARQRGVAGTTVGTTRSPEARRLALESGAVDEVRDLADVARGADLVVLATPVHAMADMVRRLGPSLEAGAILTESALSFLGLGVQPPFATWGNILADGKRFIFDAPWLFFIPGTAIFVVVLAFNLVGEGMREALNPKGLGR